MKTWSGLPVALMVAVLALVACAPEAQPAEEVEAVVASYALDTSYDGALGATSQLALGTMLLEETGEAIGPDQAETLLPLWQVIQAGTLQSEPETDAVLKQIEETMTAKQLTAIAAMQLTVEDVEAWVQEQGLNLGPSPGAVAADRAAGGGKGGQGANLSEEEQGAMRATAEASGVTPGGRQAGTGAGQLDTLANPLVGLLARLAGE